MAQVCCGWCVVVSAGWYWGVGMSTHCVDIVWGSRWVVLGGRCGLVFPTLLLSQALRF